MKIMGFFQFHNEWNKMEEKKMKEDAQKKTCFLGEVTE